MQNADIAENFEECNEVNSLGLEASKQQLIWIEVTAAALGAPRCKQIASRWTQSPFSYTSFLAHDVLSHSVVQRQPYKL